MTKCSPFCSAAATVNRPRHVRVFLLPPNSRDWLDFGGRLSLLFAVNFCRASSPWIFISPLTPLNVNSSFPALLFISVAWWFDHAENTRLAIASSLVLPQGHLLLKCYCLCFLTLWTPAPLQFAVRLRLSPLRSPSASLGAQHKWKSGHLLQLCHIFVVDAFNKAWSETRWCHRRIKCSSWPERNEWPNLQDLPSALIQWINEFIIST